MHGRRGARADRLTANSSRRSGTEERLELLDRELLWRDWRIDRQRDSKPHAAKRLLESLLVFAIEEASSEAIEPNRKHGSGGALHDTTQSASSDARVVHQSEDDVIRPSDVATSSMLAHEPREQPFPQLRVPHDALSHVA